MLIDMKKLILLLSFVALSVLSFGQNFTQGEVDNLKVFECADIKVDSTHDHYVFIVQDTINNVFYRFNDTTLADTIPTGGLKTYLNDTLLNTVKIVPVIPVWTSTRDSSAVGLKITDL